MYILVCLVYSAVVTWLALFVSICLHECGHYLAARVAGYKADAPEVFLRYGWPMSGKVKCRGTSESTIGSYAAVLLAGPLVNAFMAVLSFALLLVGGPSELCVLGGINLVCTAMSVSDYRHAAKLLGAPLHIDFDAGSACVGGAWDG